MTPNLEKPREELRKQISIQLIPQECPSYKIGSSVSNCSIRTCYPHCHYKLQMEKSMGRDETGIQRDLKLLHITAVPWEAWAGISLERLCSQSTKLLLGDFAPKWTNRLWCLLNPPQEGVTACTPSFYKAHFQWSPKHRGNVGNHSCFAQWWQIRCLPWAANQKYRGEVTGV